MVDIQKEFNISACFWKFLYVLAWLTSKTVFSVSERSQDRTFLAIEGMYSAY